MEKICLKKRSKNCKNIKNENIEKQKSLRIINKIVYLSNVKQSDLGDFLKARFVNFKCQKYVKKGYMEMRKTIYLEL